MRRFYALLSLVLPALLLMLSFTVVSAQDEAYRRWLDDGKTFTCTDLGGGVIAVVLSNQNVEFNHLPPSAEFSINYIENGVLTFDGYYPVEQTSGTRSYNQFTALFTAYPLTFAFRLDTLIDGIIVYQSTVSVACTADGVFPVTPVNVNLTAEPVPSCLTSPPADAVQGRLISTINALFEPDAASTTNVILPGGSAWWIMSAKDGFYQLWIACQAAPVWVPASAIGPNYDPPANGAPLPDSGAVATATPTA